MPFNSFSADIDIDVVEVEREKFGVRAIIYNEQRERIKPHASGIYINQEMPFDPDTMLAVIPYEEAESIGFRKIDLLNNSAYLEFKTKQELRDMASRRTNWSLFQDEDFVKELPQLNKAYSLLQRLKPSSIEDLADVLALMRPGKNHLVDAYIEDKEAVRQILYTKVEEIYFKKSHAIAYATLLVALVNKFQSLHS